jgi:hypothetical protein
VVLHLRRGGLADIDRRQPVTMPGLDLPPAPHPATTWAKQPRGPAHSLHGANAQVKEQAKRSFH